MKGLNNCCQQQEDRGHHPFQICRTVIVHTAHVEIHILEAQPVLPVAVTAPSEGKGCPWWVRKGIQTLPTGTVTFLQSQVELRPCPVPRLDRSRAGCCPSSSHAHEKPTSKSIEPHPCAPAAPRTRLRPKGLHSQPSPGGTGT